MSHETSIAAWAADVSGSTLLVLVAMADWCNPKGICYPSMARIAHRANISERQARRAVSALIQLGGLTVIKDGKGGRGKAPMYRVTPERLPQKAPFVADWYEVHPEGGAESPNEKADMGVRVSSEKADMGVRVSSEKADMGGRKGGHARSETRTPVSPQPVLTTREPLTTTPSAREAATTAAARKTPEKNTTFDFRPEDFPSTDGTTAIRSSSDGSPNGRSGGPISSAQPYEEVIGPATWTAITTDFARLSPNLSSSWLRKTLTEAPGGLQRESLLHALEMGYRQLEETAKSSAAGPPERQIRNWPRFGRSKVLAAIEEVTRGD